MGAGAGGWSPGRQRAPSAPERVRLEQSASLLQWAPTTPSLPSFSGGKKSIHLPACPPTRQRTWEEMEAGDGGVVRVAHHCRQLLLLQVPHSDHARPAACCEQRHARACGGGGGAANSSVQEQQRLLQVWGPGWLGVGQAGPPGLRRCPCARQERGRPGRKTTGAWRATEHIRRATGMLGQHQVWLCLHQKLSLAFLYYKDDASQALPAQPARPHPPVRKESEVQAPAAASRAACAALPVRKRSALVPAPEALPNWPRVSSYRRLSSTARLAVRQYGTAGGGRGEGGVCVLWVGVGASVGVGWGGLGACFLSC